MSLAVEPEQSVTPGENDDKPASVRKRRRVYGEKICQVCGEKALAHHFGALACETCKAFFRRNALSKDQRKCLFKGDCPINIKTRRFCPPCRLTKCFAVGMQADLILDDEEKKLRMLKMTEKKNKKEQGKLSSDPVQDNTPVMSQSPVCSVTTTGTEVSNSSDQTSVQQTWLSASDLYSGDIHTIASPDSFSVDHGWNPEGHHSLPGHNVKALIANYEGVRMGPKVSLVNSGKQSVAAPPVEPCYSSLASDHCIQETSPRSHVVNLPPSQPCSQVMPYTPTTSVAAQFQETNRFVFQHVPREELPSDPHMYWRLSEEERSLLSQLSATYQDTVLTVLKASPPRDVISDHLITIDLYLQESEWEAGQVVNFAKRMGDFRQLNMDEQIALLKASTCQVMGIRNCALYIAEKNAWLTRHGYLTGEHMQRLVPDFPNAEAGIKFYRDVKSIVKNDVTLYALLHCLVLFNPCDENIIDRQLINSIRDKYIILLRHYLESVYSYAHSDKYMMALQENLFINQVLCQEQKPLIKQFFPIITNQLLLEVLDIN